MVLHWWLLWSWQLPASLSVQRLRYLCSCTYLKWASMSAFRPPREDEQGAFLWASIVAAYYNPVFILFFSYILFPWEQGMAFVSGFLTPSSFPISICWMGERMNTSDSIFKVAVCERVLDVVILNWNEIALEWMQFKFFNFLCNCFHGSGFFLFCDLFIFCSFSLEGFCFCRFDSVWNGVRKESKTPRTKRQIAYCMRHWHWLLGNSLQGRPVAVGHPLLKGSEQGVVLISSAFSMLDTWVTALQIALSLYALINGR